MKKIYSGLDVYIKKRSPVVGQKIGLLVHPASVSFNFIHDVEIFKERLGKGLVCLLSPQHGLYGETQDNMIEKEDFIEPCYGLPVFSLYSRTRKPDEWILHSIDTLIIDLQDVGARYYTFIWTMALCLQACAEHNKGVVILDRPNPLGGDKVEGNISSEGFLSFVGLYPLPPRYGLTIGELAHFLNREFKINASLTIVWMEGWKRKMYYGDTFLPWIAPSPNMPRMETAMVYPGMCLLEGTNISEGRGTTLPFELFGAPFIQPWELVRELNLYTLPGVAFRPCYFQPTFHKFQGELCGGAQVHVTDRCMFKSYLTGIAILRAIRKLYPHHLAWKSPPYEYEFKKLPIDILCGTDTIRQQIDQQVSLNKIEAGWRAGLEEFLKTRQNYLHYD